MKTLYFTVTNDLTFDQRMIRICSTLAKGGYKVVLVGRRMPDSIPFTQKSYIQKRLRCFFDKGKAFYIEYNLRLFLYLISRKMDCICAIDLDTILPCYFVSILKNVPRVYDAHELFCEMKEVITRPRIYRFWKAVEKFAIPRFKNGYTVNQPIADEFRKMYGVQYSVIQNFPVLEPVEIPEKPNRFILYQGAVNEGRSFETLVPAMHDVNSTLIICGDGNFMKQARELVQTHGLSEKVQFNGRIPPEELKEYTRHSWIGVTLFENKGLSNYLSLGNRFTDYIHACVPQLCVNYPLYREVNDRFHVALLISDLSPRSIAESLNRLLTDMELYDQLQANCKIAREHLNWETEEIKLLGIYRTTLAENG